MAEAFIVRRGGVGSSGGTLVVTSSGAGTVTVSNSALGKSYSKSVTAGGSVTFKGLKTGEWTITVSNGAQTATKTITITSDYSTSIAYFAAYINITYPANSTCVVTSSSGQSVAGDTNAGSSTKTWTAIVGATGTYTVAATATDGSGKSKSTTVSITTDGQTESVTLQYELYLYKDGDKFTDVTGGWTAYNPAPDGSEVGIVGYVEGGIEIWCDGSKRYVYAAARTTKKIDLTDFNTLQFTSVNSYGNIRRVEVSKETTYLSGAATLSIDGTGDKTVDISALSGEYYVIFMCLNQEYIDTGLKVNNVLLK